MTRIVKSNEEFNDLIKNGVTLVDFFAVWCGPCKMLAPVLDEVAKEFEGRANVVKVDVDELGQLANKYNISAVPTIIIFKDGEIVAQTQGFRPKQQFVNALNQIIG